MQNHPVSLQAPRPAETVPRGEELTRCGHRACRIGRIMALVDKVFGSRVESCASDDVCRVLDEAALVLLPG